MEYTFPCKFNNSTVMMREQFIMWTLATSIRSDNLKGVHNMRDAYYYSEVVLSRVISNKSICKANLSMSLYHRRDAWLYRAISNTQTCIRKYRLAYGNPRTLVTQWHRNSSPLAMYLKHQKLSLIFGFNSLFIVWWHSYVWYTFILFQHFMQYLFSFIPV